MDLFGDQSNVFKHNAWDQVKWNEEQEQNANEQIEKQIQNRYSAGLPGGVLPVSVLFNWSQF